MINKDNLVTDKKNSRIIFLRSLLRDEPQVWRIVDIIRFIVETMTDVLSGDRMMRCCRPAPGL